LSAPGRALNSCWLAANASLRPSSANEQSSPSASTRRQQQGPHAADVCSGTGPSLCNGAASPDAPQQTEPGGGC
jgi:hypothetical protein